MALSAALALSAVAAASFFFATGWRVGALAAIGTALTFLLSSDLSIAAAFPVVGCALWLRSRLGARPRRFSAGQASATAAAIMAGYGIYELGRVLTRGERATAIANGRHVIKLERDLGAFFEPGLQSWLLESGVVESVMMFLYRYTFLGLVLAALLWLFLTDLPGLRLLMLTLGVSAVLGLITIGWFPVAPPRYLPDTGIIDVFGVHNRPQVFVNEFAAVPSLHVGWLAACGVTIGRRANLATRVVLLLPAAGMTAVVIGTGNHFWLDAAVGILYIVLPLMLAHLAARGSFGHTLQALIGRWLAAPRSVARQAASTGTAPLR